METMTVSTFRKNMATAFNKAATGEHIMVKRCKQTLAIVPIENDGITITPELQAQLDLVREEYKNGNFVRCSTKEDIKSLLDTL